MTALQGRVFLVVVDDSEEVKVALRYACLRALHTDGRVALLYVLEPTASQGWIAVEDLMREEQRHAAEERLERLSAEVQARSGKMPVLHLREGKVRDELLSLIDEDKSISILVLGASTSNDGPGPLVTHLVSRLSGRLPIPITVVPGALTDKQLEELA